MGEVYRARDTKLKRDVALKVLPEAFARDPDRMARFQREAEVLASMNHPNNAHIYGIEERALVMEFVEGESPRGPMSFEDAWKIMTQVADGLEYAHERRVVHRDLKPANLKVTPEGRVKILDFGLAKALSTAPTVAPADFDSPTFTMGATQAGVILGTAAYMAPEQIKGKEADRRADIWAFGVVLYELLTGERPFKGKDSTEIMARAVTSEPVLDQAPARVKRLLAECLQKEPEDRLGWIGDARMLIEEESAPAPPSAPQARNRLWPALAALFALTTAVLLWLWLRRPTPREPAPVIRIATSLPLPLAPSAVPIAVSRDGTRIAYAAGQNRQLYLRTIDQLEAHAVPGVETANSGMCFSPDGQQIAYVVGSITGTAQLKKVVLAGGSVQTLASVSQTAGPVIMDWGDDGEIIYVDSLGLWQIPSTGGTPASLLKPDPKNTEIFFSTVQRLPGGKQILLTVYKGAQVTEVIAFDPQTHTRKSLLNLLGLQPRAQFIAGGLVPGSGYIAYYAAATASLMAVPFDVNRLAVSGVPVSVLDGVAAGIRGSPFGALAVSNTGTLIYVPGAPSETGATTLVRVDRKGKEEPLAVPSRTYQIARESPTDPNRIAVTIFQADGGTDIWVLDVARGTLDRITNGGAGNSDPIWTPDGKRIIYHASTGQSRENVIWAPADRSAPPSVLASIEGHAPAVPGSVSADRKVLFGNYPSEGKLWTLPLPDANTAGPASAHPRVILDSQFSEHNPAISPDGHWLAYGSNDTGGYEVYVTSYPEAGPKITISTEGGVLPHWSPNGKELFYRHDAALISVDVQTGAPFRASRPKELFAGNYRPIYDVEPDGQHFLMIKQPALAPQSTNEQLTIVFNWFEELRRRVPLKQ